jgi:CheY-like chemotaxis protein
VKLRIVQNTRHHQSLVITTCPPVNHEHRGARSRKCIFHPVAFHSVLHDPCESPAAIASSIRGARLAAVEAVVNGETYAITSATKRSMPVACRGGLISYKGGWAGAVKVLIIDDEPRLLEPVSKLLTRQGYEVFPVNSPRQALEIVSNDPGIDVVVSDDLLPEIRGTELLREIGNVSPSTVSVLMTGGTLDSADVPVGVSVLKKPFSTQELICAISAALERSAQLKRDLKHACERSLELRQENLRLRRELQELGDQNEDTR